MKLVSYADSVVYFEASGFSECKIVILAIFPSNINF